MIQWMTGPEAGQIERALAGADVDEVTVIYRMGSPWLSVDVWVHFKGPKRLALWRRTGAVHELDDQGAASDDPVIPAAWDMP